MAGMRLSSSSMFQKASRIILLCDRCNTFVSFCENEVRFAWQVQHFGYFNHHNAWQVGSVHVCSCVSFGKSHCQVCVGWRQCANRMAGVRHRAKVILHSRGRICLRPVVYMILRGKCNISDSVQTLHPAPRLHLTRSALRAPRSTLHTVHSRCT